MSSHTEAQDPQPGPSTPSMVRTCPDLIPYPCVMSDAPQVKSFADLIREARVRNNMTQEDLEKASGVHRNTLSRWERGLSDRPEPDHVRAVCRALGIDPRRAAVSLGYLSADEVDPPGAGLPAEVQEILTMLEDGQLSREEREHWVGSLRLLYQRARGQGHDQAS